MPSTLETLYSATERALFDRAPRLYRALYCGYKAWSDRGERRLYRSALRPGMVVADVGANIGVYTEFFADCVGPSGAVHAFEPDVRNFARLAARPARPQITLNRKAVGARTEELTLYVSAALNVDHKTYDSGEGREAVTVECVALDDYFEPGERVDFIKMDIQGFEYHAITGMDRVLRENPEARLVLEYFPDGLEKSGASARQLRARLADHGFTLYGVSDRGGRLDVGDAPPLNALGYTNVFAERTGPV